ncbi:MAG: amidohydrolase family protein [Leucobacter sp.]|nr:amidohydrolase family protein [Leucobacter sp.]
MNSQDLQGTFFQSAHVFDGVDYHDGPQDVLVQNGHIVSVTPAGAVQPPPNVEVHDCAGKTIAPGLIDTHVHLGVAKGISMETLTEPFSLQFFETTTTMKTTLHAGVTTVRDAGGIDLGAKVAQERGVIEGPSVLLSINILSQTGGHGDGWIRDGVEQTFLSEHPGRPSGVADGADGVRAATRRLFRAGADQIKICTTGGVLSAHDDPRHSQLSRGEIEAIVEEAEMRGSYVMAHAQGAAGIRQAVEAGVRSIEHGIYLDEEIAELMVAKGAYLVPTLQAPMQVIRNAEAGLPMLPQTVDKAKQVVEVHRAAVELAHRVGVQIAMGTDAGVGPHGANLEELELLTDTGLTDVEALRAATSTAAELLRLDQIGRVSAGARADLIVVAGELEADGVKGLSDRVAQVWQNGRLVRG